MNVDFSSGTMETRRKWNTFKELKQLPTNILCPGKISFIKRWKRDILWWKQAKNTHDQQICSKRNVKNVHHIEGKWEQKETWNIRNKEEQLKEWDLGKCKRWLFSSYVNQIHSLRPSIKGKSCPRRCPLQIFFKSLEKKQQFYILSSRK